MGAEIAVTPPGALAGPSFRRRVAAILVAAGALVSSSLGALPVSAQEASPSPAPAGEERGPATDTIYFKSFFVDRAPLDMQAGNLDLYLYGLKTEAALDLREAEGVRLIEAPATSLSLILNPADAPEGQLNPFSLPEVRQAIHYLVDRDFIAQDIYQGQARPMVTQMGPFDPDFLTVYDIDRGSGIAYYPELAQQMIDRAMTRAGAEKVDGRWQYEGKPVRIKLIARVEDERREIGDILRAELEKAGFEVSTSYDPFAVALQKVYASDPAALDWHVYTEGWGRAPQRYDSGTVNAMFAPWTGNMPGWQEEGFWQYEQPELDELGKRLFRGEFGSQEERDQIYRRMTELGRDEAVRIWLATVVNSFPASDQLEGTTTDVVAGPRNPSMLREASIPGRDELTVGHQWVWTNRTTWNPVGGLGDVYSTDVWRNVTDPPLLTHPITGKPQPFRATYEVETAGPEGTLEVPADAVTWDATADAWAPVAAGTQAVSKVTYDFSQYLGTNWHHGQPITLADAMYSIAQGFDLAYDPEKVRIETALAATSRPYLETIKGYRITEDDRLEVYVDYWHFQEDYIASYATPTSLAMPWEVLYAMDELVFGQRRAAYSDTAAARYDVPWLSLVMRSDAGLVDRTLRQLQREGTLPQGVFQVGSRSLVTTQEADARYGAAQDWYDAHDNLVIADGPYMLERFDAPANFAELHAFRDPTYPFGPGDHLLGDAPTLSIGEVEPPEVVPGDDAVVEMAVEGPGSLGVRYLLLDPATAAVVAFGEAEAGASPGQFAVTIPAEVTGTLLPGLYQLYLAAHSDELALISERRVDLDVTL